MENIYIKTFGCTLNQSDSELMAGMLNDAGFKVVLNEDEADVIIINSCTVKTHAENKLYREIKKHNQKIIIVAGCVPQADKSLTYTRLKDYSIVGTDQITNIVNTVKQTLQGKKAIFLETENKKRLNLPKLRKNKAIEIIPISKGCLGDCTYCKTKQARGTLYSYDKNDIIKQAKNAIEDGIKEIWLTSQDTGAYGLDNSFTLPNLLKELIKINGNFKIRLGMCNPNFALKYLDSLIEIFNNEKMFRFIHIPMQSGNNRVLKIMNRYYTKEDVIKVVKILRKNVKGITIATDVILGFPTENENEFKDTLDLIKILKPDIVNISRFWKRPGTKAEKMMQLDSKTIKQRSRIIKEMFEKIALENNKKWLGWSGSAIIEKKGKNNTLVARNYSYKPIIIKNIGQELGKTVNVKIKDISLWDLRT